MPRNISGLYSLPAGNPAVPGTLIESTWANLTMNDIAAALTASLPRDGSVGMTGPLILFRAGQVSMEAVTFLQVFTDPTFNGTTVDGVQVTGTKLKVTTLTVELPAATSIGNISAAELAVLNGLTATTAELNILDGATLSTAELNLLDGVVVTTADINSIPDRALLDSPNFTGVPTAPTAPAYTASTQLATTDFVMGQSVLAGAVPSFLVNNAGII